MDAGIFMDLLRLLGLVALPVAVAMLGDKSRARVWARKDGSSHTQDPHP